MPPALTNAHTLERFSQIENFLTQHDSMPPALSNAYTLEKLSQIESFLGICYQNPHKWKISLPNASSSYKRSQMGNFLTQHDSMPPALTNAHTLETFSQMEISSPSMILCLQLFQMHTH